MAEYVPFPTKEDEVVTDRSLRTRVLGCFGCGGLGVLGFFGVLILLIGGLGSSTSGCDIDVGDPGEGTASQRLPVTVSPRTGLSDGATVRVTSDAFDPYGIVGVAVCLRSTDTQRRGVKACDEVQGARYATDAEGHLDATYLAPRVITVGPKAYDCAASPRRCLVVAADADDYDESGGQPISFRSGLPPADLTTEYRRPVSDHLPIGASPTVAEGPVAAGTELEVLASGFQPGEPLLLAYCTSELDEKGVAAACEPIDATSAISAVVLRSVSGDLPTADARGGFTTTFDARATIAPFGDDLGKALERLPSDPSTTTSTPRTTTTQPGATTAPERLGDGEVRCTAAQGGCSIVIAAAADTKRSAVLPFTVAG